MRSENRYSSSICPRHSSRTLGVDGGGIGGGAFPFCLAVSHPLRGEGRNRTRSSPTASLNTLIYSLTLLLQGFKPFLELHATYRL
jgi:hypothetical protein